MLALQHPWLSRSIIEKPALGIPQGSLLIASSHFLEHKDNYFCDEQQSNLAANQLSQLSSLSTKRCPSKNAADDLDAGTAIRIVKWMMYHEKDKRMLSNSGAFTEKMSFDEVLNTLQQFHLLRPIISKNDQDTSCLANFLGVLQTMGLSPVGVHDLIQMGTTGLVSCHCPVYVLLPFTVELYATMHPKQSDTNECKGRKKKARWGGALDIEGKIVNEGVITL
jgi:hypothetical protein